MLSSVPCLPRATPALAVLDRWLERAAREVRLLGAATPINAASERARLDGVYASGKESAPRWEYARSDQDALLRALAEVARQLHLRDESPLTQVYAARARELQGEAALASAIGTRFVGALACARFDSLSARVEADSLAREWLHLEPGPKELALKTDSDDPRSLLRRMQGEVRGRRLPFMVKTSATLTSLAAMSHDTIWVAEGRDASPTDVERTLVHELLAHAMPRLRASKLSVGIFGFGTARGSDDQEGLALLFEERCGFSTTARRRELAARHVAVARMRRGASFVEVVRSLRADAIATRDALRIAERAFRGSDGHGAGLGREGLYLDALVRVRSHLAAHPSDEAVLGSGLVAIEAIETLRPFALPGEA